MPMRFTQYYNLNIHKKWSIGVYVQNDNQDNLEYRDMMQILCFNDISLLCITLIIHF